MENSTVENSCCPGTEKKPLFRQPIVIVLSIATVIATGLYFKWPAIVALGIAPLILSLAPCAMMCAVGVCGMTKSKDKAIALKTPQDSNS